MLIAAPPLHPDAELSRPDVASLEVASFAARIGFQPELNKTGMTL